MLFNRWNRVYLDPDSGAGGADAGPGGGTSSAPAGAPAADAPATGAPASTEHNGVLTSDPGSSFDPSIDELKADVKAHIAKEKSLAQPVADGKPAQPAVSQPPGAQVPAATPFSANHYAWGNHFGLTQAQVDSFQTPAQFEGWVQRQQKLAAGSQPQQNQPPARETPAQPPQPAAPPQPWGQFKLEGNPEDYDPQIVKFIEHQNQRLAEIQQGVQPLFQMMQQFQQMAPVFTELTQFQTQQRQQAQQQTFSTIDKTLESIDDTLYGKGDPRQLGPAHVNARIAVSDVLARLEAGYNARGEALPPLPELIQKAHAFAYPDRIRTAALAQAAAKSKELRGQAVAVPTSREPKPLSPEERAQKAVAQKLKEFGDPSADDLRSVAQLTA